MWILQLSWLSGIGQKASFGFSPDTTVDPDSYHLFTRAIFVLLLLHACITITLLNDYYYNNPNEQSFQHRLVDYGYG